MKYLNIISKIAFSLALVFVVGACSMFDLDVNKNPNVPSSAAPDLLLTSSQVSIFSNYASNEGDAATFVGMMGTQATSRWDLQNTSYDGLWNNMYNGPLKDLDALIAASQTSPTYLGIAQTLKAYAYATMVDLYGDVPFTEAGQADAAQAIKQPKFDKDADIYTACLKLLDDAIVNLAKSSPVTVTGDLMYNGDRARWGRLAKSMKLKLLITARKGLSGADAQINALIASGGFISGTGDDFRFVFSKDPTSVRHPWYTGAYTGGEFDYTYINHQFMMEMLLDLDPRSKFYFYRQTRNRLNMNDATARNTAPCNGISCKWGYIPITKFYDSLRVRGYDSLFINGLFGRDRGDATGIPADGSLRTIPGVYPCGGYYDSPNFNASGAAIPATNAATGGGIFPVLTEVNILYYQIEAALSFGGTGNAKTMFESAIRLHIARVSSFGLATDAKSVAPTAAEITTYVNLWLARYDAAADNTAKLNVVMKQLWFSSYGNGFEIYNTYRRTGLPNTLDELNSPSPKGASSYVYRLPYAQTELNLNGNAAAYKDIKYWVNKIFWNK